MPGSSRAIKKEYDLIKQCLELFESYYEDLEKGKNLSTEDLRIAIYALDITLEECSAYHPQTKTIFETLRRYLWDLRFFVDQKDGSKNLANLLAWKLLDLNELLRAILALTLNMENPAELPQGLKRDPTKDYLQTPRMIIDRLRSAKGLSAA